MTVFACLLYFFMQTQPGLIKTMPFLLHDREALFWNCDVTVASTGEKLQKLLRQCSDITPLEANPSDPMIRRNCLVAAVSHCQALVHEHSGSQEREYIGSMILSSI